MWALRRGHIGVKSRVRGFINSAYGNVPIVPARNRALVDGSMERLIADGPRLVGMGDHERGMAVLAMRGSGMAQYFCRVFLGPTSPRIDPEAIRKTLRTMQELHPMLRCRIVKHKGKFWLLESPETQIPVYIRKRNNGEQTFRDIYHKELQRGTLALGQDVGRVYILEDDPSGVQEIVFGIEHFTSDGTSTNHFLHEFFQLLSGQKEKHHFPKPSWNYPLCHAFMKSLNPNEGVPGNLKIRTNLMKHMAEQMTTAVSFKTARIPRGDAGKHLRDRDLPHNGTTLDFNVELKGEDVGNLIAASKQNQTSITAAIAECYGRAIGERNEEITGEYGKPKHVQMSFPMDVRRFAQPAVHDRSMTPFVGSLFHTTKPTTYKSYGKPMWRMAQGFSETFRAGANSSVAMYRALIVPRFFNVLPSTMFVPSLVISNWGSKAQLKEQYGGYKIEGLHLLQNFNLLASPTLSVYTKNGKDVCLSLYGSTPYFDPRDLDWVSNRAHELMKEMIRS